MLESYDGGAPIYGANSCSKARRGARILLSNKREFEYYSNCERVILGFLRENYSEDADFKIVETVLFILKNSSISLLALPSIPYFSNIWYEGLPPGARLVREEEDYTKPMQAWKYATEYKTSY